MPDPRQGESRDDFLDRCIPEVVAEGREPDQAVAMCLAYYEGEKDKAFDLDKMGEVEYWKAFDRKRESFVSKYQRKAIKAINEMLKPLSGASTVGELRKDLRDDSVKEFFEELYTEVGDSFARTSYSGLKGMRYMETKQEPIWIERMRKVALVDGSKRIKGIVEKTRKDVNAIIVAGLENGLSVEGIKRQILERTDLPPLPPNTYFPMPYQKRLTKRARTIARTEIISASNAGSLAGADSTGLNYIKRWLTTIDGRERTSHASMNTIEVPKGQPFIVNGEELKYPGDPNGSAKNVINCRCTQIYKTGDDVPRGQDVTYQDYANKTGDELEWHKKHGWDNDDELKGIVNRMPELDGVRFTNGKAHFTNPSSFNYIDMNGYRANTAIGRSTWHHEYGHFMDYHYLKAINSSRMGSRLRKYTRNKRVGLSKSAMGDVADDYTMLLKNKKAYQSGFYDDIIKQGEFHETRASSLLSSSDTVGDFKKIIDNGVLDADEVASLFGFRPGELDDYIRRLDSLEDKFANSAMQKLHKKFYTVNHSLKSKYPEGFNVIDADFLSAGLSKDGNLIELLNEAQKKRIKYYSTIESSKVKDYIGSSTANRFNVRGHTDDYYQQRNLVSLEAGDGTVFFNSHASEAFANHIALRASSNARVHEKYLNHFFPRTQTKFRNIVTLTNERKLSDLVEDYYVRKNNGMDLDDVEKKLFDFLNDLDKLDSTAINNTTVYNRTLGMSIRLDEALNFGRAPRGYVSYKTDEGFVDKLASLVLVSPGSIMLTGFFQSFLTRAKYKKLLKYMDKAISGERALTNKEIEDVFGDYPDGDV